MSAPAGTPRTRSGGPGVPTPQDRLTASTRTHRTADVPTVPVPADVLAAATRQVAEASERLERERAYGHHIGWHLGRLAGYDEGWKAGHAAGVDAGGTRVLLALRSGWPDLAPARRLASREYVSLLDGPGVAAPCTCSCCRRWRDGRPA